MHDAPRPDPDRVAPAHETDIDRTLIRENLKLTVEARFRKAMALAPRCRVDTRTIPCRRHRSEFAAPPGTGLSFICYI
jgi:hypothetical protein